MAEERTSSKSLRTRNLNEILSHLERLSAGGTNFSKRSQKACGDAAALLKEALKEE